jgi:hypothetical protein
MSVLLDMNIDSELFFGSIIANFPEIQRTLTAAMGELGIRTRGGVAVPPDTERLGYGRWGAVFTTTSPGWTWKVTADPDEGPVVASIIDDAELRDDPGICYYGGIWRFAPAQRFGLERLFLILREELRPVDELQWNFSEGEAVADELLDYIVDAGEYLNAALASGDEARIEARAEEWGELLGQLRSIDETRTIADFMLKFLRRAGGALADVHRSNCGVRARKLTGRHIPAAIRKTHKANRRQWVIFDPGVSRTHRHPTIPLVRNPGIPFLLP